MTGQGKTVGSIWETSIVQSFVSAYDAFYPALIVSSEVLDFLAAKAAKYKQSNTKSTMELIRTNIEDGILRQVFEGVKKAQIRGNHGMHQNALALAAIVLDEPGTTEEWLDFVFREGKAIPPEAGGWAITGGNMLHALVRDVDRDGFGDEAAPLYNNIWVNAYKQVADIMFGYDRYPQGDFYRNAKFRQMLRAHAGLIMIDRYMPQVGDSDSAGNPNLLYKLDDVVQLFEKTSEPIYAQLAVLLCGNSLERIRGGLFSPDPERVLKDIKDTVEEAGPFHQESLHLANYGLAAMRDGAGDDQRALWMYHGRNFGHGHRDTLNIGLYAFGLDLAPELGYPEKCDNIHQKTHHWDRSTVAHNTVTVDRSKQNESIIGQSLLFIGKGDVQVFEADAANVYSNTAIYRRCAALIRIDDKHSYVIDTFAVKGGKEHHYVFHGAEGAVETEGLNLVQQRSGTFAGADVQYGEPYDADPALKLQQYKGSGFHYLSDVVRDASPPAQFSVDWTIRDTWGVLNESAAEDIHIRLTMLTQADEAALADGHPSANRPGNPERLRYLLVNKQAANEEALSRFVSVIEPYKGERLLHSITRVGVRSMTNPTMTDEAVSLRIELKDGRVDYYVHSLDPQAEIIVDERISFQGTVGLYSEYGGEPVYAFVAKGSRIGRLHNPVIDAAVPALTGTVREFSRELGDENWIRIHLAVDNAEVADLTGTHIFVEGTGRNPVFQIHEWEACGSEELILNIGHVTLIQDWADKTSLSEDDSSQYRYAIAEGDRFTIPLSTEWRS
jgi:hypothetical protein